MTHFFKVRHNTAYTRGMPEIYEIVAGLVDYGTCSTCGVCKRYPSGDIQVRLGKTLAKFWPDAIACGEYPCFVVSDRFVNVMEQGGARLELGGKVDFVEPNESGLSLGDAPKYFWIDGKQSFAAKMDFEASGYVDVQFCPECGVRSDDISLTHKRQHANPPPGQVFDYDEASGLDLFTTDLAPTAFFCTDLVFESARKNNLTNLAFRPVEQGSYGKPIKY